MERLTWRVSNIAVTVAAPSICILICVLFSFFSPALVLPFYSINYVCMYACMYAYVGPWLKLHCHCSQVIMGRTDLSAVSLSQQYNLDMRELIVVNSDDESAVQTMSPSAEVLNIQQVMKKFTISCYVLEMIQDTDNYSYSQYLQVATNMFIISAK